jgi:hypothetical protein
VNEAQEGEGLGLSLATPLPNQTREPALLVLVVQLAVTIVSLK